LGYRRRIMDMETILPRTCINCHGQGYLYFGDKEEWDVQPCEDCDDEAGSNYLLAADAYDEMELLLEEENNG
jgi:hypothetical protein